MEILYNTKPIQEIIEVLPNIKDKIDKTTKEYSNYLEYLKNERYEEKANEGIEEAIKRAEGVYDRLDEIVKRREVVMKNGKETIQLIDIAKLKIEKVVKSCENDEELIGDANNELIDKIIDLEHTKLIIEIEPLQKKIDNFSKPIQKQIEMSKERFEKIKKEWDENRMKYQKKKTIPQTAIMEINEIKQIEEWTKMKIGNILFDSDVDDWKQKSSVFDQKIINKSNLIFIVEDNDGNKFGGYVGVKIDNYGYINDPKSFLFSLKSNGRLNGMSKFDITQQQYSFYFSDKAHGWLFSFGFGQDICVYKEKLEDGSFCNQVSFNYKGIKNSLCGKTYFTPKRITVIQLI